MVESATMKRCGLIFAMIFVGALLPGCGPLPPVKLKTVSLAKTIDYDNLAAVLDRALDKRGYVAPTLMSDVEGKLLAQLQQLAKLGPTTAPAQLPSLGQRLAYWYNARAAWSIYLAMDLHRAKRKTVVGLTSRSFPLDGQRLTLADIDAKLYALAGLEAVIAAPSMNEHRAELPRKPFDPKTIQQEIARRFNSYIGDRGRFIIDIETQQIRFAPIFWQYRTEILRWHNKLYGAPQATLSTALLPRVTGLAGYRLQQAVGYKCVQDTKPAELTITGD